MTESWSVAGLIVGSAPHYIDHLAPLSSLLQVPLLVTEEEMESTLKEYYPGISVQRIDAISLPAFVAEKIDIVFVCTPRVLFDEIFFFAQKLQGKKVHTIWCPHGNSDKGHRSLFMEGLKQEEVALLYGEKMIDFLKEKKAFSQLKKHVVTGNFRKAYYLKHKAFCDSILRAKVISKLPKAEKTVLYAPTWQDKESSSSFYEALPFLVRSLPKEWNLIVKPHPNLLMENEEKVQRKIDEFRGEARVHFLLDFPLIFPLLDYVDIYVGDFSSIGYDFLSFNKPMFFLNSTGRESQVDPGLYLYQCGVEISSEKYPQIYSIIEQNLLFDKKTFGALREKIDSYTFGPRKSEEKLKQEIEECYSCFPDKDLNFYNI